MKAHLEQHLEQPAIAVEFIVAGEDDWSGVDDCGAIHLPPAPAEAPAAIGDDEWWPGRCIP